MCGIVGYVGDKDTTSVLLVGLERLSYRGYDSSGISVICDGELSFWKRPGKIAELSKLLDGFTTPSTAGIGHTRWATHGIPNEVNAHPHNNAANKISVVHNGIIENYIELRKSLLQDGFIFRSETDTEVIVHLLEKYYDGDMHEALYKTIAVLEGSFSICVVSEYMPETILAARKGSPLIIGVGQDENFVSSDINAILPHTKDIYFVEDGQTAVITKQETSVFSASKSPVSFQTKHIDWNPVDAEKNGYDHYMFKEIMDQPTIVRRILSKYVSKQSHIIFKGIEKIDLTQISRFTIQACGTSWHAGLIGKYLIEKYARILTEVDISSEFRYRQMIAQGNDMVLAISQSGETADTLAGIREAKSHFFNVLSFVNVKNSTIDRESDGVIYSHSGQEVGVASTKNYTAQLVCIYLFAIHLGYLKGELSDDDIKQKIQELNQIPDYIDAILAQADKIETIANKYYLSNQFLFIGRGLNYPSALEGALKLKEISYIHATGYAAGELKHGPIALIDSKLPVVCVAPNTSTYEKMMSNIQEVKSRKGKIIAVVSEGNKDIHAIADDVITIPDVSEDLSPMLVSIPLQLLSYYIALKLDCDVDQPRNLAKSVTVE